MNYRLLIGDVREQLATLEDGSVDCVVTSPPYWGLRDYGTGAWDGGAPDCDHTAPPGKSGGQRADRTFTLGEIYRDVCPRCGARRVDNQIGLEDSPDLYVQTIVGVFREVRRVLADHGTCWVNLGDSYASPIGGNNVGLRTSAYGAGNERGKKVDELEASRAASSVRKNIPGLKPKDLVGIPWRTALALQADGWWLRSDVIWSKPNPMPESVTDRPTKAHEFVFLLTKGEWKGPPKPLPHVSDQDARWLALLIDTEGNIVLKPDTFATQIATANTNRDLIERAREIVGLGAVLERQGTNAPMFYWQLSDRQACEFLRRIYPYLIVKQRQARVAIHAAELRASRGRKRPGGERDPKDTAELTRCWESIKALNHFGDPDISWAREPKHGRWAGTRYWYDADAVREPSELRPLSTWIDRKEGGEPTRRGDPSISGHVNHSATIASRSGRNLRSVWEIPTYPYPGAHFATFPPKLVERCVLAGCRKGGTVLDPFAGSGTTLVVALRNHRDAVGIELNPEYAELARKRLERWWDDPVRPQEKDDDQLELVS